MKNKILHLLGIILMISLYCSNAISAPLVEEVSGNVTQDTTWSADTIKITGNITVLDNAILTIQEGTYVKFMGYYELGVQGTILAEGSSGDTIYFSVHDTTGWIDVEVQDGSWAGISFLDSAGVMVDNDSSVFDHCKFSYAKVHYNWNRGRGAAIGCEDFHKIRVSNCHFIRNHARQTGGAIDLRYADMLIKDSYFYYNIGRGGGCIYSNFSSPVILRCTFHMNFSLYGSGGAVKTANGGPEIKDCDFTGNFASYGGAIDITEGDTASILNNYFFENYGDNLGGGARLATPGLLFRNNEIRENGAKYGSGSGIYISGCEGSLIDSNEIYSNNLNRDGSGMYISGGHPSLVIRENKIYDQLEAGIIIWSGNAVIEYNEIYNNLSGNNGGGIWCVGGSSTIQHNRIYSNSSSQDGGGISIEGNQPYVFNNIISNNTASDGGGVNIRSDCKLVQNIIVNNQAGRGGAGFIDENSNPLILNNTICMNKASSAADGGAFIVGSYTFPRFYNNIIYDNLAGSDSNQFRFLGIHPDFAFYNNNIIGGMDEFIQPVGSQFMGTYQDNTDKPPALVNPSVVHGTAGDGLSADWRLALGSPCINKGLAIVQDGMLPPIDYFGNNRIRYSQVDQGIYEYHDTVMEFCGTIESDTIWAADTISICNEVTVNQGATLRILPGVVVKFRDFYKMTVSGSIIAEGTLEDTIVFTAKDTSDWEIWSQPAGWEGLFVHSGPNEDSSKLSYCRFELCNKQGSEGVLNISNTTKLIVRNCLFYHNESFRGAGITLDNSPILIRDCDFIENNTLKHGSGGAGAIEMSSSNAVIDNCRFSDGYSYSGVIQVHLGAPVIRNCLFRDNYSRAGTGVIWMQTKTGARIHHNVFYGNYGTTNGGAIAFRGNPLITNNFIFSNFASKGAGIYGSELLEGAVIRNNVIVNNRGSSGVGLYFTGHIYETPRILVYNNTIVNNKSKGGKGAGIYTVRANIDLRNNILWGNLRGSESDQINIRNMDNGIVDISYCNIQHGLDSMREDQPTSFTNNIDSLPYFVNPTEVADSGYYSLVGDWSLLPVSPSINSGDPAAGEEYTGILDILGNERIHMQQVDMGAIENLGNVPLITGQPEAKILCESDSARFRVSAADSVFYQWTKDGIELEGAGSSVLNLSALEVGDQGNYQCNLKNSYGETASNSAFLQVRERPSILQQPVSSWAEENTTVTIETFAQGSDLKYQWLKNDTVIPGAKTPKLSLENAEPDDEGSYHCIVSNACASLETDTVDLYLAPQICMVTVSEATGHNLVVWEKGSMAPILAYNVYRISSAAGIYNLLATLPEEELSVYVDTTADPTVQAYLYKITAIDTAGNETDIDLCKPHKTIHLLVSTNPELNTTQLEWDNYHGFEYQTYNIYRSSTGTNFNQVHSMASNFNSWTDPAPEAGDQFYRIAVERPIPCYPSGGSKKAGTGPYQHAISNMDDNKLKAGENPPDSIFIDNDNIDENMLPGSLVGRLVTVDVDTLDYYTYHLVEGDGDEDNGSFSLIGDLLVSAETFDYETKDSYQVRIRTTDNAAYYLERAFTISINDTEEGGSGSGAAPPDSITIDNTVIAENNSFGDPVGQLLTADPDVSDIHTYRLVKGEGDDDNLMFMITGDVLRAATSFDFETKNRYSIRVRSTDLGGNQIDKIILISIIDVSEPAVGMEGINEGELIIYPNPATGIAMIRFANPGHKKYNLRVYDISGQMILSRDVINGPGYSLHLDGYDPGYYLIELKGTNTLRGRLIVE